MLKYTKYTEVTDPKILFVTNSTFYASLNIITSPRGSCNYGRIITNQNKIKVLYISPDGCCTRICIYYFTLYLKQSMILFSN